jgi:hypothetical protein
VPLAVTLLNFISCGILWRIFPKLKYLQGFLYVYIIYIAGRISTAAMAGDIIFFSLAGPMGHYTGANTVIFRRLFPIYYSPEETVKLQWVDLGAGNIEFFRVPNSLEGCHRWDEGRGMLYFKASVVPWKDI